MSATVLRPILRYSFEDNLSDGIFQDTSGNSYDGTVFGTVNTSLSGISGQAAALSGGYIKSSFYLADRFDVGAPITNSVWFNTNTPGRIQPLMTGDSGGPWNSSALGPSGQALTRLYGGSNAFSDQPISGNQWHHLVWGTDGTNSFTYVDGVKQAQGPLIGNFNKEFVQLGAANDQRGGQTPPDGRYFSGLIDEVQIFDVALTEHEVRSLYHNPTSNLERARNEGPSNHALEYFAKQTAYDFKTDGFEGYTVIEPFETSDGFHAVALKASGKSEVLAIRGSADGADWANNFNWKSAGYSEFQSAWQSTNLQEWLRSHPDINIVGHSQGGAQAQLIAANATALGIKIGNVYTFNSPGIPGDESAKFRPENAGTVRHYIVSGDVVSMVGDEFINGEVEFYDFDSIGRIPIYDQFLNSHTNHWAQEGLYSDPLSPDKYQPPVQGRRSASDSITFVDLGKSSFSYIWSGNPDGEYFKTLLSIAHLPLGGAEDVIALGLVTRGGAEALRVSAIPIATLIEAITSAPNYAKHIIEKLAAAEKAFMNWTAETVRSVQDWTVETWAEITDWTADRWARSVEFARDVWDHVIEFGPKVVDAAANLIDSVENTIGNAITSAWDHASSAVWSWATQPGSASAITHDQSGIGQTLHAHSTADRSLLIGGPGNDELFDGPGGAMLFGAAGANVLYVNNGANTIAGTLTELDGDRAVGFTAGRNTLLLAGETATRDQIITTLQANALAGPTNDSLTLNAMSPPQGSAILGFDLNRDGAPESTIVLEGDFATGTFLLSQTAAGTAIHFSPFAMIDVFRFYNAGTGTHFFTGSDAERQHIVANPGGDPFLARMAFEGPAYFAFGQEYAESADLYRFYNTATGAHFFTASEAEKNQILTNPGHDPFLAAMNFEGTAYHVLGHDGPNSIEVWRFYNTGTGVHFYTASEAEKDLIVANPAGDPYLAKLNLEGVGFWVPDPFWGSS